MKAVTVTPGTPESVGLEEEVPGLGAGLTGEPQPAAPRPHAHPANRDDGQT
jgi:hypothetical protein